ncbi:hypothetical protein V1477_019306, partial [Vespula maculifrons]
ESSSRKKPSCRSPSFGSFAQGHRYLEDATAASLSDSSKIVFQTDRKAGGHRRVGECGGGERETWEGWTRRSPPKQPSTLSDLSVPLFRSCGDPSGLPVTLASTTISSGECRYSVSVLVATEPAAPIHH